jgi:hypothetical protein
LSPDDGLGHELVDIRSEATATVQEAAAAHEAAAAQEAATGTKLRCHRRTRVTRR